MVHVACGFVMATLYRGLHTAEVHTSSINFVTNKLKLSLTCTLKTDGHVHTTRCHCHVLMQIVFLAACKSQGLAVSHSSCVPPPLNKFYITNRISNWFSLDGE